MSIAISDNRFPLNQHHHSHVLPFRPLPQPETTVSISLHTHPQSRGSRPWKKEKKENHHPPTVSPPYEWKENRDRHIGILFFFFSAVMLLL